MKDSKKKIGFEINSTWVLTFINRLKGGVDNYNEHVFFFSF